MKIESTQDKLIRFQGRIEINKEDILNLIKDKIPSELRIDQIKIYPADDSCPENFICSISWNIDILQSN